MTSLEEFRPLTSGRLALALQFFPGDQEMAMRNALRIARNEPAFRKDVEFVFVERFDARADLGVVAEVGKKFKTSVFRSTRKGVGHPAGCNDLWCDWMSAGALGRWYRGEWKDVKAVFTFEADAIPVHPDWINKLSAEWDRAAALGKFIVGCWMDVGVPGIGHINGNSMYAPNLVQLLPGAVGCPASTAWDMFFGPMFAPHWYKSGLIANYYRSVDVSLEQIQRCWAGSAEPAAVIHGVKSLCVERYADQMLRGGSTPILS